MSLEIIPLPALQDNYIWILKEQNSRQVACVDPGDAKPVIRYLETNHLTLGAILITHHHWDHTNGIAALLKHSGDIPVYGPQHETIPQVTHLVQENDKISLPFLESPLTVLEIPGHTLGHIAYYIENKVFCGDTLFTAGCGRLFEGTAEQMYSSLNKLSNLGDQTLIYCGHEYTLNNLRFSTMVEPENIDIKQRLNEVKILRQRDLPTVPAPLKIEKLTNPFLRCQEESVKLAAEQYYGHSLNSPIEVWTQIRQWKNSF